MFFGNSLAFSMIQWMLEIWSLVPLPFLLEVSVRVLLKPVLCLVIQSYPTLCDPMDSSPPGSSVHRILQSMEWVAMLSSRGLPNQGIKPRSPTLQVDFLPYATLNPSLDNFERYFASMWNECNCAVVWIFFDIAFLWDWNENGPFPVLWPLLSIPKLLTYWVQHFYSILF